MKKNIKLNKMKNDSLPHVVKKLKRNHHIPNISEVFSTVGNRQDWWLPLLSNTRTPIKKDTSKLALMWANTETPKQIWI